MLADLPLSAPQSRWFSRRSRLRSLDELDGRTAAAIRARRLVASLLADAGGEANATEGMRQLIQRAAVIGAFCEDVETRWIAGESIDLEPYLAAANTQKRVLATIGLERRSRDVTPDPLQYAQRYNGTAAR